MANKKEALNRNYNTIFKISGVSNSNLNLALDCY
jgi:hypothetical protein